MDNTKPFKTVCEHCNSELEIMQEDLHIGWLGAQYVTCPCCNEEFMIDEIEGITVTVDNIKFPCHFIRTNKDLRACVEIQPEEIEKEIRKGIEYLRKNKKEFAWCLSCGDMYLHVYRYVDNQEYTVVVSKDYYEANIAFTYEDF